MRNLAWNLVIAILLISAMSSCNTLKNSSTSNSLIGTWELCSWKDSLPARIISGEDIFIERKLITPETFTVLHLQKDKKRVYSIFAGSYIVDNGIYSETIEYSIDRQSNFVGTTNSFTFRIEKDLLFVSGTNNKYNQVWRRVKK